MAHRGHDTVGTRIESPLDHPFLRTGNTDNGACVFRANRIGELDVLAC